MKPSDPNRPSRGLDPVSEHLLNKLKEGLQPGEDPFYWDVTRDWAGLEAQKRLAAAREQRVAEEATTPNTTAAIDDPLRGLPTAIIPLRRAELARERRRRGLTRAAFAGSGILSVAIMFWAFGPTAPAEHATPAIHPSALAPAIGIPGGQSAVPIPAASVQVLADPSVNAAPQPPRAPARVRSATPRIRAPAPHSAVEPSASGTPAASVRVPQVNPGHSIPDPHLYEELE